MYELLKDVLVPLVAPLIAIITLLLFARNERKKFQVEAEHKIDARASAIKRDLEILLATYKTYAMYIKTSGTIDAKRVKMIDDTSKRLLKGIYQDSLVYEKYLKHKNVPLLLSELEVRLKDSSEGAKTDRFLHFAFLRLFCIMEDEEQKRTEYESACNDYLTADPEFFSPFMK